MEDDEERRLRIAYQDALVEHSNAMIKLENTRTVGAQAEYIAAFRAMNEADQRSRSSKAALESYRASKRP